MGSARLGLGLAALGRPAYINLGRVMQLPRRDVAAMRAASFAVLDAAYAAGVRHVDVARSYGRAEEFLSQWMEQRAYNDVSVSSKWGYAYVGDWRIDAAVHERKEHTLSQFRRQWQESRELLGGTIGLYQVHSLTPDSPLFTDHALLEALAGLSASGTRVGFTTSGPAQGDTVRRALDLEVAGQRVFSAVQSTWNVLEPSVGPALAEAHDEQVLVLLKETLANGRLAVEPPAAVTDLAAARDTTCDAIALAAALAQRWADLVLIGPAGTEQVTSNLLATGIGLTGEESAALVGAAEAPESYWTRRSSLSWR
jgi:aryl-alcohol dehydrogenase-like predicted oxidoreductase